MRFPTYDEAEALKRTWTDRYVRVKSGHAEYERFAGKVGRVVTVNYGGRAIVDFADGAWYDIPATDTYLELVTDDEAKGKYDATTNSAQKLPPGRGNAVTERPPSEFRIGDRVRVVPSERHSTPHSGAIRQVIWHGKDERYNYYIEENGKKVSTRYLAVDLELMPSPSVGS